MNNPGDESSQESASKGSADPADQQSADNKRSGRAAHDERGNSVWEWQLETGVYSRDISTQRLKKLDLNDLSIAETASIPRPPGLTEPPARNTLPGGGVNPYDNSTTDRGNVASDPYNSGGRGALKTDARSGQNSPPARKPVDLKKLDEWLELRKRVEQNKREEGDED